jgi:hypothetical protein
MFSGNNASTDNMKREFNDILVLVGMRQQSENSPHIKQAHTAENNTFSGGTSFNNNESLANNSSNMTSFNNNDTTDEIASLNDVTLFIAFNLLHNAIGSSADSKEKLKATKLNYR